MAMSKKHFEMIARNIAAEVTTVEQNDHWSEDQQRAIQTAMRNMAVSMCADFRDDNPNFDGHRFLKACGF